jgi:uncharacterized protein (TIGR01244 family)
VVLAELKMSSVVPGLTVSAQLRPEDFPLLAARGVTLVINNRPDGEEPGQLTAAQGAELARGNGMEYRHLPVVLPNISETDIRAFAHSMATATGPVHGHCRSGLRSVTLWALGEVTAGRLTPEQAQHAVSAAGFDPKTTTAWLAAHGTGPAA